MKEKHKTFVIEITTYYFSQVYTTADIDAQLMKKTHPCDFL
jgi:hypothetical protein